MTSTLHGNVRRTPALTVRRQVAGGTRNITEIVNALRRLDGAGVGL